IRTNDRQDRPKNFVEVNGHVLRGLIEDCGAYVKSLFVTIDGDTATIKYKLCAFFDACRNGSFDALFRFSGQNRAKVRGGILPWSDLELLGIFEHSSNEGVRSLLNNSDGRR